MDDKSISLCGRVADTLLGERLNGIQEVSGSIPLISTKGLSQNDFSKSYEAAPFF